MVIRQETSSDQETVNALVKAAFASAEHSDGNESDLVAALRKGSAFVPELSLVAEIDGQIVGHILFTKAAVGVDTVLVLAPLSVAPNFQKQGIGTALIREGHKRAAELGYGYSLVLGSEVYYPRCGYLPAEQMGITVPDGFPTANFMAMPLREPVPPICGTVVYTREFGLE